MDIVPFKVLLIDYNALMPVRYPILETFFYIRFSVWPYEPSSMISSWLLKRVPQSDFLIQLNKKKSQGAKSVEFGGCWMVFVPFLVKKLRITMALCDRALHDSRSFLENCYTQTQIIKQNVLNGFISDVQVRCHLSNGQFTVFGHHFFDFIDVFVGFRCRRPATAFVIIDRVTKTWLTHKSLFSIE